MIGDVVAETPRHPLGISADLYTPGLIRPIRPPSRCQWSPRKSNLSSGVTTNRLFGLLKSPSDCDRCSMLSARATACPRSPPLMSPTSPSLNRRSVTATEASGALLGGLPCSAFGSGSGPAPTCQVGNVSPIDRRSQTTALAARTLMFAEWGDPGGSPVFLLHGTPSSRLSRHPDENLIVSTGVRVITYDRPDTEDRTTIQVARWPTAPAMSRRSRMHLVSNASQCREDREVARTLWPSRAGR